jgi:muconolactone D-isomerase
MNYLVKARPTERLGSIPTQERERLLAGEREAAAALIASGVMIWMWYLPGSTSSIGIWNADNEEELDTNLKKLPFFPYHEVDITALAAHPAFPTPLRTVGPAV